MKRWRTRFYRKNFNYKPALEQSADVVFETDIPCDDEHGEQFEAIAWKAMWEQVPHFKNPSGGWSSVMGGNKYEQA